MLIEPFANNEHHAAVIAGWLRGEWEIDPQETRGFLPAMADRPAALVALIDSQPVGVLAYRRRQEAFQSRIELWVNVVFVAPEFRRQGIARALVQQGSDPAYVAPAKQLFAYTDVPTLYEQCGWRPLIYNAVCLDLT
ncbi:MAG: GNAT family N-acetyltransferase [Planctomycetota bacterium]